MLYRIADILRRLKQDPARELDRPAILDTCRQVGHSWRASVLDYVATRETPLTLPKYRDLLRPPNSDSRSSLERPAFAPLQLTLFRGRIRHSNRAECRIVNAKRWRASE